MPSSLGKRRLNVKIHPRMASKGGAPLALNYVGIVSLRPRMRCSAGVASESKNFDF